MRLKLLVPCLVLAVLCGCSGAPPQRSEPVEIMGTVKLPAGKSAKGLTVSFQPLEDTQPAGGVCGEDGSFTVKAIPGKYYVHFNAEANARVSGYAAIPEAFRKPSEANTVSLSPSSPVVIEPK